MAKGLMIGAGLFLCIALVGCTTPIVLHDVTDDRVVIDIEGIHTSVIDDAKAKELTEDRAQTACGAYDKTARFVSLDEVQKRTTTSAFLGVSTSFVYRTTWACR